MISQKRNITSVMGFWRPVKTFASLIGVASGNRTDDSVTVRMRSAPTAGARGAVWREWVAVIGTPGS